MKQQNTVNILVICLRVAALGTSVAATWLMLTSNQSILLYGIPLDAKYSYSPSFKFFAFANAIASVFSLLSVCFTLIFCWVGLEHNSYLFLFLHDLVIMSLVLAGCAAATAIGYVGQKGNGHAGWMPICDHFQSYCHRATTSVVLGYISFIIFFFLTLISGTASGKPRQIHVPQLQ